MDNILPLRKKEFSFEDEIRELTDLCKEDLVSVNTIILDKLDSNVPLVHEVGKYLILSGGKRLRPLLTCLLYTSPSPRDLTTSRMPSSA